MIAALCKICQKKIREQLQALQIIISFSPCNCFTYLMKAVILSILFCKLGSHSLFSFFRSYILHFSFFPFLSSELPLIALQLSLKLNFPNRIQYSSLTLLFTTQQSYLICLFILPRGMFISFHSTLTLLCHNHVIILRSLLYVFLHNCQRPNSTDLIQSSCCLLFLYRINFHFLLNLISFLTFIK